MAAAVRSGDAPSTRCLGKQNAFVQLLQVRWRMRMRIRNDKDSDGDGDHDDDDDSDTVES